MAQKNGWPPIKIFKRKKGAADCSDGQSCDTPAVVRSGSGFSVKKRYKIGGKKKEDEPVPTKQPTSGTNMNVRDLGGNPGQPTYNAGSDRNVDERKKAEIKLTKRRKYFGK